MKNALSMLSLTLIALIAMDAALASLIWAARGSGVGVVEKAHQRFQLGKSVPGKLADMTAVPVTRKSLFAAGWPGEVISRSASLRESEADGPHVRAYGMSFLNFMTRAYAETQGALPIDLHAGPGGPLNYVFALFRDDRENRQAGDVVVLGVLASTLHGAMSFSNRSWLFDQPLPLTYPIFAIEDGAITEMQPVMTDWRDQISPPDDLQTRWMDQLRRHDLFYTDLAYAAPVLDASPFVSSIRRAVVKKTINRRKTDLLSDPAKRSRLITLTRAILAEFGRMAREDGQTPLVVLIQDQAIPGLDLQDIAGGVLRDNGIAYLNTADIIDPADRTWFKPDLHFIPAADKILAAGMKEVIERERN